ncbi:lysylphosphatidylglycerol synthase domain-containing protein [Cellulomonas alba]|uniref:Lysylphosphatidylglycerol synthase domain-containing protein n=1 Tax=Cellulomonas alba TaxID=3053467 RepID=A0ABT7SD82_9CELL|nr:lysylphosphatidylglycerol synthase domain-containing protein [Cellulomonas alba]MDM7854151.1 lysylphosphatidylglycerol synthase domain-containing protein [Cellulomonas alba]
MTSPATVPVPAPEPVPLRRRLLRAAGWLAVVAFAWWAVTRLAGAVDWDEVAAALRRLSWWALVPMVVLLLVRQTLNAAPMALYVPGLGLWHATQNDLSAHVVATFAPPPADLVLRVAQFRSWDVDPVRAMTGMTLNMATYYGVRVGAPVLGLAFLAADGIERRQWLFAGLCALATAALGVAVALILRGDAFAAAVGRAAGRAGRLVRRGVDPEAWAARVVQVRQTAAGDLRRGILRAVLALVVMLLVDASILLVALRAVGVGEATLPTLDVLGAFLLAYPLTILPMAGLGVVDALLVGGWTVAAGTEHEGAIVAATLAWRVVTIGGTLLLGTLALVAWRWRARRRPPADGTSYLQGVSG